MTPAQSAAGRAMIEEVYQKEIELARARRNVALLKTGLHPQLPLARALVGWGEAMRAMVHGGEEP